MLTETLELEVLHCVVKHASYAKAAEELGLSPSGVSRIITRLEERLGVRLMQRTTRKLALTEAGASFYGRTLQVISDLAEAEAEVQRTSIVPRGNLRISVPVVFGQLYVAPMLDQLLERYAEAPACPSSPRAASPWCPRAPSSRRAARRSSPTTSPS
jgi:DNA-binding transcriptional LysR family regulator